MKDKYGKLRSDGDGHDYIIPESLVHEFDFSMQHLESVGCQGEPQEAYWSAIEHFEKLYGQYQIDGHQRDFKILLPDPPIKKE